MFILFNAEQRKILLQMLFKLQCNVVIHTLFVMQQKLQMQHLFIELNTKLYIMICFRVSILYS